MIFRHWLHLKPFFNLSLLKCFKCFIKLFFTENMSGHWMHVNGHIQLPLVFEWKCFWKLWVFENNFWHCLHSELYTQLSPVWMSFILRLPFACESQLFTFEVSSLMTICSTFTISLLKLESLKLGISLLSSTLEI